jgi:hypothetical protein
MMRSGTASYLATGATTNEHFALYRWDMTGPPTCRVPAVDLAGTSQAFACGGGGP